MSQEKKRIVALAYILVGSDLRQTDATYPTECVMDAMPLAAPTNFKSRHNNKTHHYKNAASATILDTSALCRGMGGITTGERNKKNKH